MSELRRLCPSEIIFYKNIFLNTKQKIWLKNMIIWEMNYYYNELLL